ncbi:MAG: DUF3108 domain-containing protein [Gallionellaceae bacterium]|nr:DUF3108 domain-containing protein [Gallionellaceae bacterium]
MKFISRFFLLLLCFVLQQSYAAPQSPARIKASYAVLKDSIKGAVMEETFTRTQDRYRIESTSKAIGLLAAFKPETIHVTSEGGLTAKGLRPTTYIHERKLDTKRNSRADFNWASNNITLTDRTGTRTQPLPADTQDRLSAMYQFMFASLQKNTTYDFHMTNGSKVDIYNYLVTPDQSVTVPLGTFKALYIASPPKPGESRTEIWLSTEHANFPFKMIITDKDGDQLIQEITEFTIEP